MLWPIAPQGTLGVDAITIGAMAMEPREYKVRGSGVALSLPVTLARSSIATLHKSRLRILPRIQISHLAGRGFAYRRELRHNYRLLLKPLRT